MNILIVENNREAKLNKYEDFLYYSHVDYEVIGNKEEAINYIEKSKLEDDVVDVDGIILNLGIPEFRNGRNFDKKMGLEIISYLQNQKLKIPVLIYSSTELKYYERNYPYIYGQLKSDSDLAQLEKFLNIVYAG